MSRPTRVLAAIAAILALSTGVLVAQAATLSFKPGIFKMVSLGGGGAVPTEGPVIAVPFDKTQRRYLSIDEEPLELRFTVAANCGGRKFYDMSLEVAGATIPVSTIGMGKGGGGFSGAKTLTTNAVTTRALDNASVPNPVGLCNDDLAAHVKVGAYGKAQKGWARQFDNALPATLSLRCVNPSTKSGGFSEPGAVVVARTVTARFPVWVHCRPAAVFKTDETKPQPRARRSSDVAKEEPQRVRTPPQRVGSVPQRVAGQEPAALPDLLVADAQAAPTSPGRLRVLIANKGSAASAATKLTLFYHRSGKVMKVEADVPALAAGATRWIVVDAGSPLAYASQITLRVDDPPGVPELDENNNAFTVK